MKKIALFLVAFLLVGMYTYANGQQEGTSESGSSQEQTTKFDIEAPEKNTEIDVIGWAMPITEFYMAEFGSLNTIDNLKVNTQLLDGASAQEQVRLALSGDKTSPYEVIHASNAQISEWGFSGWLMPLNELIDKYRDEYDLDDIPQTAWDAVTVDGEIVGIPAVGNSFQLVYRKDLFEKHGIEVPQNYDEVIAAAQKLKANEDSIDVPFVINLHAGWAYEIEFLHFLRAHGGTYIDEDGTAGFAGPEGVAALKQLIEVADKAVGDTGMSYSVDDTEIGLQTGRIAFSNTWASRAVNMNNPEKSAFPEELAFAPSPRPVKGGPLGASAWNDFYCIPKNVEVDPELIFKAIMETTDLESQMQAAEHGIPTRMKTMDSDKAGPYMSAAMKGIANGVGAYPNHPALQLARTALGEYLPLATEGKLSPQEVLDKAATKYNEEAKANGFIE